MEYCSDAISDKWLPLKLSVLVLLIGLVPNAALAQCRCFFERPLDVVLILDTSDSMGDVIDAVKSGAEEIVQALGRHVRSFRVGLILYGYDDPKLIHLTENTADIIHAIRKAKNFGNYEPIDQALDMAIRQMKWNEEARKVIVLVGDEEPDNNRRENGIELSYKHAEECARMGITIHTVSATPDRSEIPEFKEIARRSGGKSLALDGAARLPAALIALSLGYNVESGPPEIKEETDYGFGPLLIAKLDMGEGWNMDRSDVADLLAEAKDALQERFSWRIVGPDVTLQELSGAHILYLSAHGSFEFGEEMRNKIRNFVMAGGFILADDCCQDEDFDRSFRAELKKIFPDRDMKKLPDGHMFYNMPNRMNHDVPHMLYGIDMGCRTAVVYSAIDLSCRWARGPEICRMISDDDAFDIGVNILHRIVFYNASVQAAAALRGKGDRAKFTLGQIRFPGFWNPPTAVVEPILRPIVGEAARQPVELSDENLFDFPLLYLTGHGEIPLSREAVERLKAYLERGGFLFAEACCGDEEFDRSFREMMEAIFPDGLEVLPPSHAVFSISRKVSVVTYVPSGDKGPPCIEGAAVEGRTAVIYSKNDLTAALLDHPGFLFSSVGKQDAENLLTNIFLYALSY